MAASSGANGSDGGSAGSSAGAKAKTAGKKGRRCRPNADARKGRDTDPLTARLDRCPR